MSLGSGDCGAAGMPNILRGWGRKPVVKRDENPVLFDSEGIVSFYFSPLLSNTSYL